VPGGGWHAGNLQGHTEAVDDIASGSVLLIGTLGGGGAGA
jgi:hypothetical protein